MGARYRHSHRRWVGFAVTTLTALAVGGCFGSSGGGGSDASGGGGGRVGSAACDSFAACGGDPVGVWDVEDLCLDIDTAALLGLDDPACNDAVGDVSIMPDAVATITGDTLELLGDFTMEIDFTFDDACVQSLAGDPRAGVDATFCNTLMNNFNTPDPDSTIDSGSCNLVGAECRCQVFSKPQDISDFGTYQVEGNRFVYPSGPDEEFCVDGDRLLVSTPTMMGIGGIIVFQRQ